MFQNVQSKNLVGVAASSSGLLRQSFTAIRKASWGIASAAMVLMSLSVPTSVKADPPGGTTNWTKSFEDTFSNGFDTSKWNTTFWWGSGYINDSSVSYYSPNNVAVTSGNLTLTANNNSEGGLSYTGGQVSTYGKFYQTYGYFEARVKVATGNGMDPYFSLLAEDTSWPPETNVFEIPGAQSPNGDKAWMTTHYKDANGNVTYAQGTWTSPTRLDQDYHTYGLLWQPGLLVWYIDGVERYRTTTGVPNKDNYISLALGVFNDGGQYYWSGNPTNTNFPKSMNVSWVRAWKSTGRVGTISIKANANNKYVNAANWGSSSLIANSPSAGNWQTTFDVYDAGGNGKVALVSQANSKIVTAENAGASPLIPNKTILGPWETFKLTDQNGGGVSLTAVNNLFVTADKAGANPLIANQKAVGPSEQFYLIGQ